MWWITRYEWDRIVALIEHTHHVVRRLEDEMAVDYTRLKNDIAAQTSVITSVLVLIQGLQQMIADLKAQLPDDSAAQAILDKASADLETNTQQLSQAVPVNTTATAETTPVVPAPEPPPEPPPASQPQGFMSRSRSKSNE